MEYSRDPATPAHDDGRRDQERYDRRRRIHRNRLPGYNSDLNRAHFLHVGHEDFQVALKNFTSLLLRSLDESLRSL